MSNPKGKAKDLRYYAVFAAPALSVTGKDELVHVALQVTKEEIEIFCTGLETTVGTAVEYDHETGEPYSVPEFRYYYQEITPLLGASMLLQKVEQLAEAKRVMEAENG